MLVTCPWGWTWSWIIYGRLSIQVRSSKLSLSVAAAPTGLEGAYPVEGMGKRVKSDKQEMQSLTSETLWGPGEGRHQLLKNRFLEQLPMAKMMWLTLYI